MLRSLATEPAQLLLGCGCYWSKEYHFAKLPGVVGTEVGFAGGHTRNPTYLDVCGKQTGHAEVVSVKFEPDFLPLNQLLYYFFALHLPTIDRRTQGGQYRSAIYFPKQAPAGLALAQRLLAEIAKHFGNPFTEVGDNIPFYLAPDRHQAYCVNRQLTPRPGTGIPMDFWQLDPKICHEPKN